MCFGKDVENCIKQREHLICSTRSVFFTYLSEDDISYFYEAKESNKQGFSYYFHFLFFVSVDRLCLISFKSNYLFLLQLFGRVGASQKQSQSPQKRWQGPLRLQYGRSVQVTLALMLTFFLLGKLLICLKLKHCNTLLYKSFNLE